MVRGSRLRAVRRRRPRGLRKAFVLVCVRLLSRGCRACRDLGQYCDGEFLGLEVWSSVAKGDVT